jgi:hypothetical protein
MTMNYNLLSYQNHNLEISPVNLSQQFIDIMGVYDICSLTNFEPLVTYWPTEACKLNSMLLPFCILVIQHEIAMDKNGLRIILWSIILVTCPL